MPRRAICLRQLLRDFHPRVPFRPDHSSLPRSRYEHLVHRTTPSTAVFWISLRFCGRTQQQAALICALMSTPAKYQPDPQTRVAGFKNCDWFPQIEPCKSSHTGGLRDGSPQRLCGICSRDGGWEFPAALRHVPPGTRTVLGLTIRRPPTLIGQATVPAHSQTKVISRPAM